MPTHKKGQDKDKYYHLAKDQGYRSRAAFKLIQINKRFDFLSKARVCVDLCAAPGGWCQVAAKLMPAGSIVLGVDLMPIKAIRNVKTIISDITTAECRRIVNQELQGWKADVVLCDGAPNVGAAYAKDAYVQNELVLAALKTATDHLTPGGTFCTKVYRSVDYNALVWVLQQLFENVQAMKPNSSRSQSSEIFLVCLNYNAPKFIDPKLLDPNHVFKEVADPGLAKVDVLHKKYDKLNKRHRTGYDESLGILLTASSTVSDFIANHEPIRLLTDVNTLKFSDACAQYKEHPLTTPEICRCFDDLRLLGKIDFKKLLKWRTAMKKTFHAAAAVDAEEVEVRASRVKGGPQTEEEIQEEIARLREGIVKKNQREKKKSRLLASKERTRQALGMNENAFGGEEDMELFDLAEAAQAGALGDIEEFEFSDDEDAVQEADGVFFEGAARTPLIVAEEALEDELEDAYLRYVKSKKASRDAPLSKEELLDKAEDAQTVTAKRARKERESERRIERRLEADSSAHAVLGAKFSAQEDVDAYVKMLSAAGENDSDDDDDNSRGSEASSDDGSDDDALAAAPQSVVSQGVLPASTRAGKWFSNPIFKETMHDSQPDVPLTKASKKSKSARDSDMSSAAVAALDEMPKTDKEIRQEKRKKDMDRQAKKKSRNSVEVDPLTQFGGFEVAPGEDDEAHERLDEKTKQHRALISQGLGKRSRAEDDKEMEIVPAAPDSDFALPVHDHRSYDSDNEDYDGHDRAVTLAIGTMMLRTSKRKALVDASYNRFSWNDPKNLPSWFLDDEARHNKPQLPVPAALLEQIKSKFQSTGTKDIKKVAEARMRKRKRAATKLSAAKKQANIVADNSEMSDKQKIKAIARAMKTNKGVNASKVYVVTRKSNGASVGTKGEGKGKLKFVDSRMKKDQRATRANKKRSKKH